MRQHSCGFLPCLSLPVRRNISSRVNWWSNNIDFNILHIKNQADYCYQFVHTYRYLLSSQSLQKIAQAPINYIGACGVGSNGELLFGGYIDHMDFSASHFCISSASIEVSPSPVPNTSALNSPVLETGYFTLFAEF